MRQETTLGQEEIRGRGTEVGLDTDLSGALGAEGALSSSLGFLSDARGEELG